MCPPLRAHSQARPSGMVTDATIISERGRWKEEAGTIQGAMVGPDKRRMVVEFRGSYLKYFSFVDKFRVWQEILHLII